MLRFELESSHFVHGQLGVLVLPAPGLSVRHEYHVTQHRVADESFDARLTTPDGYLDAAQLVGAHVLDSLALRRLQLVYPRFAERTALINLGHEVGRILLFIVLVRVDLIVDDVDVVDGATRQLALGQIEHVLGRAQIVQVLAFDVDVEALEIAVLIFGARVGIEVPAFFFEYERRFGKEQLGNRFESSLIGIRQKPLRTVRINKLKKK